jgi:uncharacterized protein YigE (DUF2233 family)
MRGISLAIWLCLVLWPIACAAQPAVTPAIRVTLLATHTPSPTPTRNEEVWCAAGLGIEVLRMVAYANGVEERLIVARVDARRVALRVLYDPQAPRSVREWQSASGAALVVNGGFFDEDYRATGLLIADGRAFGRSYRGFGGMFFLRKGKPDIQSLRAQPYRPDPAIRQAVQSFPMLVVNGRRVPPIEDGERRNRRSFVAIDQSGRVLLGVTQMAQWTLNDLADFLANTPALRIRHALNLDGGASSGLWLSEREDLSMNSFEPVPAVIAVFSS